MSIASCPHRPGSLSIFRTLDLSAKPFLAVCACAPSSFAVFKAQSGASSLDRHMERRLKVSLVAFLLVCASYWLRPLWFPPPDEPAVTEAADYFPRRPAPAPEIFRDADPDKLVAEGPPSLSTLFADGLTPPASGGAGQGLPKARLVVSPAQIEMVWIPPGQFTMGSPESESGRQPAEGPPTSVTLSQGFWLSRYELTRAQYHTVLRRTGYRLPIPSRSEGRKPILNVSWEDATNYCLRLTILEAERLPNGFVYRLPTEAEWEYACRAGTTGPFSLGSASNPAGVIPLVWCAEANAPGPQEVGRKPPNHWGLHDMHGNAAEWIWDSLGSYPGGTISEPFGETSGLKTVRGGSWRMPLQICRSAARLETDSAAKIDIGFRVALAPALPISPNNPN